MVLQELIRTVMYHHGMYVVLFSKLSEICALHMPDCTNLESIFHMVCNRS